MSFGSYFDHYFDMLKQKGIALTHGQKLWYVKKHETQQSKMKKEYPSTPDEAFEINLDGLYYASHVQAARTDKRVLNIPYDPTLKVHTAWDLGFRNLNAIVFFQIAGKEIHIIDFIEGTGVSLIQYIKMIKEKPYIYGTHLGPHDIKVTEYSTGVTRFETAAKLGVIFNLVPDISLQDGIDSVKNIFPRCYFCASDAVLLLLKHLENYSQAWDKVSGSWTGRPSPHDVHSHCADAFRYLAVGINNCLDDSQSFTQDQADAAWRQYGKRL